MNNENRDKPPTQASALPSQPTSQYDDGNDDIFSHVSSARTTPIKRKTKELRGKKRLNTYTILYKNDIKKRARPSQGEKRKVNRTLNETRKKMKYENYF